MPEADMQTSVRDACVVLSRPLAAWAPGSLQALLKELATAGWVVTLLDASHLFEAARLGRVDAATRALAEAHGAAYALLPHDIRPPFVEPLGAFQPYLVDRWLRSRSAPGLVVGELLFGPLYHALTPPLLAPLLDLAPGLAQRVREDMATLYRLDTEARERTATIGALEAAVARLEAELAAARAGVLGKLQSRWLELRRRYFQ